jgi:hypothetical protein
VLRLTIKKIDAAFRRLRDRRIAAGISSTAETPEQEAKRIADEIQSAQMAGDIATIMRLVVSTSQKTTADFIKETCGSLLFLYYTYVDKLHSRPVDIDDLVDGILYLDAKHYIEQKEIAKHRNAK